MAVATFDTLKFANTLIFKDLVTKDDLSQAVKELRQELQQSTKELRQEIKLEVQQVREDLKSESLKLNAKMDTINARLTGEMLLLKWMLGATITSIVGILVRLLLYRTP